MSSTSSYLFNNTARIGSDVTDQTQNNVHNTRSANHMLSSYFSDNVSSDYVNFAIDQPTMSFSGVSRGKGLNGNVIDNESSLLIKDVEQTTPFEKLQLFQRPFVTVPYLGRGSCDPTIESQLLHGESVADKKSVSTIMDKSFSQYQLYPTDDKMEERVKDASHTVEEAALDGWVRGGMASREMTSDDILEHNNRPNHLF
tara:strand:- start:3394 stop:3990 length:597 start_codon:yes stop_codon:yes gene_type:complete